MKKNKQGFTLIELLVVVVIIGLISTLAVVVINSILQGELESKCEDGDREACEELKERFDIDLKPNKKTVVDCDGKKVDCRYNCTESAFRDYMDNCLLKCDIKYEKCEYDKSK